MNFPLKGKGHSAQRKETFEVRWKNIEELEGRIQKKKAAKGAQD